MTKNMTARDMLRLVAGGSDVTRINGIIPIHITDWDVQAIVDFEETFNHPGGEVVFDLDDIVTVEFD